MLRLSAAVLMLASAGAAAAQTAASSVTVPQLSAPDRAGEATAPLQADTAATLDRRGREALVSPGAPIGEGRRTAEAAPDLSTQAQGRALSTAPVGGQDRCDPASAAADTLMCRQRLEARAAEFSKAGAAPVTAEGRLSILTDSQSQTQTVDQATRRLGSSSTMDNLAGSASSTIAGVLAGVNGAAGATGAPASNPVPTLPAGTPTGVVLTPH